MQLRLALDPDDVRQQGQSGDIESIAAIREFQELRVFRTLCQAVRIEPNILEDQQAGAILAGERCCLDTATSSAFTERNARDLHVGRLQRAMKNDAQLSAVRCPDLKETNAVQIGRRDAVAIRPGDPEVGVELGAITRMGCRWRLIGFEPCPDFAARTGYRSGHGAGKGRALGAMGITGPAECAATFDLGPPHEPPSAYRWRSR